MMKKIGRIIMLISAILISIFSLIMVCVELYNLFTGSFLSGEHQAQNFFYYFLKFLMYFVFLGGGGCEIIYFFKPKDELLENIVSWTSIATLLVGVVCALVSLFRGQAETYIILIDFIIPLINAVGIGLITYSKILKIAINRKPKEEIIDGSDSKSAEKEE